MVWNQASEDLYDSYAQKTGDSGWAWEAIIPLWKKISTFVASLNNSSLPPPPANSSLSNGNGPVQVNFATFATDIDFRVVNSSKELEASSADGMNAGGPIGFGSNQDSAVEGTLSSSATAYLHPALNSRSSLDVLINTQVMKLKETSPLTFTASIADKDQFYCILGPLTTLNPKSEVVLSAGSIGTPQILLLFGIGPKEELAQVGVESTFDLSHVGEYRRNFGFLDSLHFRLFPTFPFSPP
ncbi:hypothetical protein K435DRAFT_918141 [Dendrothele bispora CBS 962.96]|uniref:Glucose-methanol-choline oxidoreductase N-terminal domain-containing protein n=1 Tax=Dendrothele bispora (strain CBS 962.96) TaxID=1314807 RepID=A0A4S8LHE8_DENBC|nr:hypothetical protein K435DRAFT_918141 [Dendrothele bispora CBS 962.96]